MCLLHIAIGIHLVLTLKCVFNWLCHMEATTFGCLVTLHLLLGLSIPINFLLWCTSLQSA